MSERSHDPRGGPEDPTVPNGPALPPQAPPQWQPPAPPPQWPTLPPQGTYGYGDGYGYPVVKPPGNPQAIIALVLGCAGLFMFLVGSLGLLFFLNLPCSVAAWILGVQGKRRVDRGETLEHRGLAQAGIVTGVIGVVLGALGIVGWVLLFVLAS